MAARFIRDGPYLAKERVINLTFPDLVVCSLCNGILRLPVACRKCEKPFCLSCIKAWQIEASESPPCTESCAPFVQRLCPPVFSHRFSTLQVTCRYKPNGCTEILPYNNLETHEEACGYRQIICSGCDERIFQKDVNEHNNRCALVLVTCPVCNSVYQRQDEIEHTELRCAHMTQEESVIE